MAYKHDYDKALFRLISILKRLYDGEKLSVKELALEFGTSERTISRDFNERLISFPIEKEGRLWKMQDGFHLEKLASPEDQLILDMLEKMSENLGSHFALKAKHLLTKIKNQDFSPIFTKLDIEPIDDIENMNFLEEAIEQKEVISAMYYKDGSSYKVILKPLKIANFDGFWYLLAYDSSSEDTNNRQLFKKYHLKSLTSLNKIGKKYQRSKELDIALNNAINAWFNADIEPFEVILHVDKEVAKYFQRKPLAKSQILVSSYNDGSCELSLKITHEMELVPKILYWLPHIKVLEPLSLKDAVDNRIKKYLD